VIIAGIHLGISPESSNHVHNGRLVSSEGGARTGCAVADDSLVVLPPPPAMRRPSCFRSSAPFSPPPSAQLFVLHSCRRTLAVLAAVLAVTADTTVFFALSFHFAAMLIGSFVTSIWFCSLKTKVVEGKVLGQPCWSYCRRGKIRPKQEYRTSRHSFWQCQGSMIRSIGIHTLESPMVTLSERSGSRCQFWHLLWMRESEDSPNGVCLKK
jgi:hypothetical protein